MNPSLCPISIVKILAIIERIMKFRPTISPPPLSQEYITHSPTPVQSLDVCMSFLTDVYLSFIMTKVVEVPQLP